MKADKLEAKVKSYENNEYTTTAKNMSRTLKNEVKEYEDTKEQAENFEVKNGDVR